jgi:hypothetical protein
MVFLRTLALLSTLSLHKLNWWGFGPARPQQQEAIMAQVRLLTSMAGIDFSHNNGIAEAVNSPAPIERAVKKSRTEKAVKG